MRFFKVSLIIGLILVILAIAGYWLWQSFFYLDPQAPQTYYKIFDKAEILSGQEVTASEVLGKLDSRLEKFEKTFVKITGTNDEKKLKALFYLNFVQMSAYYGQRTLKESSLQELLWGGEFRQCGDNATLLAMLLEKAGYEYRTISIEHGGHGYVEVKFDNRWNVLDPTTNIWIDKSTEEQMAGDSRNIKKFFLMAEDLNNARARQHFDQVKVNVIHLRDRYMSKIGQGYDIKIDQYNYINLAGYQY